MSQQLSSGTSIEEEAPQVRTISGVSTSILAALGVAERGPFEATLISSFDEYKRLYGGHTAAGNLSHALQGFFGNGGGAAYVKRVVHHVDPSNPATKTSAPAVLSVPSGATGPSAGTVLGTAPGAFALDDGQTLVIAVDGGAPATATFSGGAGSVVAPNPGPYALADDQTVIVAVDGGAPQTLTFDATEFADVGAATAAEVAASINAKITGARASVDGGAVRLSSDRRGTSSRINVTGGTATALGLAGDVGGTGNVANLAGVTLAEVRTIVEAAVTGSAVTNEGGFAQIASATTGPGSSVQVLPASTARAALGFDTAVHTGGTGGASAAFEVRGRTDGAYANELSVIIEAATSGRAGEFNLVLESDGVVRESWRNLSADPLAPNFAEIIVNHAFVGSPLIELKQLQRGVRPGNGAHGVLSGGADGLTGLADADFLGDPVSKTGLHGFDVPEDARLLICPDRETPLLHVAMVSYCSIDKKGALFPILSPPMGSSVQAIRTYVETTTGLLNLSEFGAMYYPNIKVANPAKTIYGADATITIPNSGHIAGVYARTDSARVGGVYDAPAGIERGFLENVLGFENDLMQEERNRDLVYPHRINPLRTIGGRPVIDGVRTLKGDGNFPSVSERRGVIFIEQSVKGGIEFARFRNNDASLRAEVSRTIDTFLNTQMLLGAFRARRRSDAYFIDVGEGLNPPSVVFRGVLNGKVGLATQKPAEFVVFRFSQDTRALTAELSTQG